MTRPYRITARTFVERLLPTERGCLEYRHGQNERGYGRIRVAGRIAYAHRYSWFLTHGDWPAEGMCVLHHCDNPPCVRPEHLFLGTNADNMADKVAKGRQVRWRPQPHDIAVLESDASVADLMAALNVSRRTVYRRRALLRSAA